MTLARAEQAKDLAYTSPARARRLAEPLVDGDAETASVALHALGMASSAVGRLDEAERHLRSAISVASRAGLVVRAAQARGSFGYVLTLTGRTSEALRALEVVPDEIDGVSAARLRMQRALVLTEIGRFEEAAEGFAAALASNPGDPLLEATIRNNRGLLRAHQRDWRGAEEDLAAAERSYVASGHRGRTAMVFHNRGVAFAARGDVPAALAAFDEAAARYEAAGRNPGLLPIERAEVLLSVRLVAEARSAAAAAVAEFARQRNAVDLVQARLLLARVALVAGDPAAALVEAVRARRSAVRQRRPGWAAFAAYLALRARWEMAAAQASAQPLVEVPSVSLRSARRVVEALSREGWVVAELDARLILARLALDMAAAGLGGGARSVLAQASPRAGNPCISTYSAPPTRSSRSGRALLAVARAELTTVAAAASTGPAELRARAWHAMALLRLADGDVRGAEAALRSGVDVLAAFRDGLGATELRAHASGHAAELVATGMRLALTQRRPAAVFGWAERWRAGALRMRPAKPPDDAQLAEDLAELRQVVADPKQLRRQAELEQAIRARARHATGIRSVEPTPSRKALAAALGDHALIEYIESDGHFHAIVFANRRMWLHELAPADVIQREVEALRFGLNHLAHRMGSERSRKALEERVNQSAARLDKALLPPLEETPLVVVPTGALHALPWPALPSRRTRSVTVTPSAALWLRAATAATEPGRKIFAAGPGLEHAVPEVAALARRYPEAERFTGRRATTTNLLDRLDGAELAHIAAHGKFRSDNPLFSRLELADGPLTVYDLERLGRPPSQVILSACEAGTSGIRPGDELLGLAAALLALGTRTLIASLVSVPDDTSKALMLRYHRGLARGLDPATALAKAQRTWADAAFQCYGASSPLVQGN
ncbi:CHAT domain-containing protein [Lentzea atacamensis]|uniref:CHAT domain-containing protein n=1 Tax=Lentzea atacamensis TaxID=531938 RepID=A0ABX9EAX9_9PSEU|nr:CHAT domain-containing protein [Lentzea atacamensis]RAS67053.1 CHAT domain-containing protein [Lentzea atacamensis]